MVNEIVSVSQSNEMTPEEILGKQTKVVNALRALINKKTVVFVDKKTGKESRHIEAIAWQSIAAMFGVIPRITYCEEDEHGMKAVCQLTRFSTSEFLGEMSAYVGRDEPTWYGGQVRGRDGRPYELKKKPMNQIRSFAQTRAIRQAIKVNLGHIALLLESFGVDVHQSAEEREQEEHTTPAQLPEPITPLQLRTIAEKVTQAGVTREDMVKRFGPADQLNQETYHAVIAHLDGLIAVKEAGQA